MLGRLLLRPARDDHDDAAHDASRLSDSDSHTSRADLIVGVRFFAWLFAGIFALVTIVVVVGELLFAAGGWPIGEYVRRAVEALGILAVAALIDRRVVLPRVTNRERRLLASLMFAVAVVVMAAYTARFMSFEVDWMAPTWISALVLLYPLLVPGTPAYHVRTLLIAAVAVPVAAALHAGLVGYDGVPLRTGVIAVANVTLGVWLSCAVAVVISTFLVRFRRSYKQTHRSLDQTQRALENFGSYRLEEKIGAGGMGEVWRARHRLLKRSAALKLIRPSTPSEITAEAPAMHRSRDEALRRFEREAAAISSLTSTNTVQIYDYGRTDEGTYYIVMELLHGIDLGQYVRRYGPMPQQRVVYLLKQACASLAEAHEAGLVHRDIKPQNLFMCKAGVYYDVLKVLDFGLVRNVLGEDTNSGSLTAIGSIPGTPRYMSPEQASKRPFDRRTDIYSLGCVAYHMLTATPVFQATGAIALTIAHIEDKPEPPSQRAPHLGIGPELDALVLQCLEKDPEQRHATAWDLHDALAAVPLAQPWTQNHAKRWAEANPDVYTGEQFPPSDGEEGDHEGRIFPAMPPSTTPTDDDENST